MANDQALNQRIKDFILNETGFHEEAIERPSSAFWSGLVETGTELWLDTGDMDAASELWAKEFTALTTNNTLLNKEVQKGIYDDLVQQSAQLVHALDVDEQVIEIAFVLNATHGLRLMQRFGGKVSVELHTDLAHDLERTLHYARRYAEISPDHFIVKVPLTPTGLIATRILRAEDLTINFTLGFSARQNAVAGIFAKPSFVNVFLGRVNAYILNNKLGDGEYVGEKATLASQKTLQDLMLDSRQIAASMREGQNVADLAGVDVFTMPTKVAKQALDSLDANWESQVGKEYAVSYNVPEAEIGAQKLYSVSDREIEFARSLDLQPPASGAELIERAAKAGVGDMFPNFAQADLESIAADGKIPVHEKWAERVREGSLAIDTLLNQAGLASFTADQKAFDDRVRGLL